MRLPVRRAGLRGKGPVFGFAAIILLAIALTGGAQQVFNPGGSTGGSGTVTSVSVVTANGVSGSVGTATTTPAITLTLTPALASLETTAAAQAAFSGIGSCTNQAVTAVNANAAPTCTTLTSAYVDGSIAPTASPTFTGTVTNPGLAAATPYITSSHGSLTAGIFSSSANKAAFVQVMLPFPLTTTQVSYYVGTADTVNTGSNYDIGIYSGTSGGTCTLKAHTGAIAASTSMTANAHTVAWTGGSVTLQPGRYYIAYTSAATTATAILVGDTAQVTFAGGGSAGSVGNVSVTAGGTLDASRTCPTDAMSLATAAILILN